MKAFPKEGLQKCPQFYHQVTHELGRAIAVNEIARCKHVVGERGRLGQTLGRASFGRAETSVSVPDPQINK